MPVVATDTALHQFKADVVESMSLSCMGTESFALGFHRARPACSTEEIFNWYMEHQEDVISTINSNMKLASNSKPKDRTKMKQLLDKTKFNVEGGPVGEYREIGTDMLQRVLDGSPHPQDLYDLEGGLVKLVVCSSEVDERYALCLLWVLAFSGMRGISDCQHFLNELGVAYQSRGERTKCMPQVRLQEAWKRMHSLHWEEVCRWNGVMQAMFSMRDHLRHPQDIMTCGLHPAYMCPSDDSYDTDQARTKNACVGIPFKVSTSKEREKRGSVFPRRAASRRGQLVYDSEDSDDDVPFCRVHGSGCELDCADILRCEVHGLSCDKFDCVNLEPILE